MKRNESSVNHYDSLKWMKKNLTSLKPLITWKTARKSAVTKLLWGISSSLVQHQSTTPVYLADSVTCHVKGGHKGFKEDRITVSLCCVALRATTAVWKTGKSHSVCTLPLLLSHLLPLEYFHVCSCKCVCEAAANGSVNKQNSPLIHTLNLWILTFHWYTHFSVIVKVLHMSSFQLGAERAVCIPGWFINDSGENEWGVALLEYKF